jgi:uncharacterized protein
MELQEPAMIFTLTELEHHPILFDVTYQPGEIKFPEELKQRGGMTAAGKAELLKNTMGEIRLRGHVKAQMETVCDRCLEPAQLAVDSDFDLFYRPVVKTENHAEIHLEEGEIDLSFYEGDGVGLRDALREHILLSLPMRALCQEGCKGLCPVCGANCNEKECGCRVEKVDARWAALKDLS